MFQRFVFPAVTAVAVCAQQTPQGESKAEKALRARVQQFYQLQVDKKFREAEAFVAADTRDLFYNSGKPDLPSFQIVRVVMSDKNTRAQVTVSAKMNVFIMGKGMVPMDLPTTGSWKIEHGQWVWFVDQTAGIKTPFGVMKPNDKAPAPGSAAANTPAIPDQIKNFNLAGMQNQVSLDSSSVELSADQPAQSVTVTNGMPGEVTLRLETNFIAGISVQLDKTTLKAGETAKVMFTRLPDGEPSSGTTKLNVAPLDTILEVKVTRK